MKKTIIILIILSKVFLLTSCSTALNDTSPNNSLTPTVSPQITTGVGFKDAFMVHPEIRILLKTVASNSLKQFERVGLYQYDAEAAVYKCYLDETLVATYQVDGETAEAICKLKEYYPGIDIWMDYVDDNHDNGVFFYINRKDTEISEDVFVETLLYTNADAAAVTKFGYEKIAENWYIMSMFMPMPTTVP